MSKQSLVSQKPQEKDLEKLENSLKELEKHYNNILEEVLRPKSFDTSGVLFLGSTGDGKTTLLTHLDGVPLKGQKDQDDVRERIVLVADDPNNLQGIYGGFRSGTRKATHHQKYWDLPGILGDTDGFFQEVINSWWISGLCTRLTKIKVAIVISEDNLITNKFLKLRQILEVIGEMFLDIDEKVSSLCLIVTKCENSNPEKLCAILSRLLSEQKDNLNEKQRKLLQYFASNQSAIAFFCRPTKEGLISNIDRKAIIEAIEELSWYETPLVSPCPGLSEKAKNLLSKLRDLEVDKCLKFIEENFDSQRIFRCIKTILDDPSGSVEILRTALKDLKRKLSSLMVSPMTLNGALHILQDICYNLRDDELAELLVEKSKPFEFIAKIDPDSSPLISNDISSKFSFLSSVCKNLVDLMKEPEIMKNGGILVLSGKIINSRDINNIFLKNPGISEFDIYSSIVIFLDDDIKAPGVSMSLLSPQVQVKGTPSINLKGLAGQSHEFAKAASGQVVADDPASPSIKSLSPRAQEGDDGFPGMPGQSGGSFFVKTNHFKDSENLSVDVSGGQGGPGQDGGDGANGVNGKEGDSQSKVENRDPSAIFDKKSPKDERFKRVLRTVLTFNTKLLVRYQAFEPGQTGGNAGSGGKGGYGGNSGEIKVGRAVLKKKIQNNGADGPNGRAGTPGTGGSSGPVYQGTFIEEKIFGNIRGHRESDCLVAAAATSGTVVEAVGLSAFEAHSSLSTIGMVGLNMPDLLATGTFHLIAFKGALSLFSIYFCQGWKQTPQHRADIYFRASNGNPSRDFNTEGRRESGPARIINLEEKLQNYQQKLEKENPDLIERLTQSKHTFYTFEIEQGQK